jgi:segregation and condensation protein B
MTTAALVAAIESLLFVAGETTPVERLRSALGCTEAEVELALAALSEQLQPRGVRLQRGRDGVQLVSAPEHAPIVERFLGIQAASKPSAAALETLAIVAYRQPVNRGQIEEIRGVNCDRVLRSLVAQGLIQEVGRAAGFGRPILYGTTDDFLLRFGLESLAALPPLTDV